MPKPALAYRPKKKSVRSINIVKKDVLRKIAFLKCTGRSVKYIAENIGKKHQETSKLLRHPYTRKYIKEYKKDLLRSSEQHFQALWNVSLERLEHIMRTAEDEYALKAINMLWEAQGRFPKENKGGGMDEAMMQLMQQGGSMMQGISFKGQNEVDSVMKYLDQTRDTIEITPE